jgi:hypothetical protein
MSFGIVILIPLVPLVIFELIAFEHTMADLAWLTVIWHAVALITSLDVGYLLGLAVHARRTAAHEATNSPFRSFTAR